MPYPGVPADKTAEMEACVTKVMAQGHDKSSAIAICHSSIVGKARRRWGRGRPDQIGPATAGRQKDIDPKNDAQRRAAFARMDEDGVASGSSGGRQATANPDKPAAPKAHPSHAPIVRRAIEHGVTDIGQLSKDERHELDKATRRGQLIRTTDYKFPSSKPMWVVNPEYRQQLIDEGVLETPKESASSLVVTKQADGRSRWVLISSSAFEDRDGEIVSSKALQADVDRADADGDYGPLRWWHIPGAELGDCDFNMLKGRMLYESGTFRDERVADAIKAHAGELGVSIGFRHPPADPDAAGVFHNIRRFERSLLPLYAASNPFTAVSLVEKESQMNALEDKLKAFGKILGGDAAMVAQVLALGDAKEKAADEAGTRHKEADADEPEIDPKTGKPKVATDEAEAPADEKKEYAGDMSPDELDAHILKAVKAWGDDFEGRINQALAAQATTKAAAEAATAETLKAYDTKLDGIAAAAASALEGVKELKGELPRALGERNKGWRASEKGEEPTTEQKQTAMAQADDPMAKHWAGIQAAAGKVPAA